MTIVDITTAWFHHLSALTSIVVDQSGERKSSLLCRDQSMKARRYRCLRAVAHRAINSNHFARVRLYGLTLPHPNGGTKRNQKVDHSYSNVVEPRARCLSNGL